MQANEITVSRLADISAALHAALFSVDELRHYVKHGNTTPENSAAVINDMMANLNALTK
jgi:hypothetical protein